MVESKVSSCKADGCGRGDVQGTSVPGDVKWSMYSHHEEIQNNSKNLLRSEILIY